MKVPMWVYPDGGIEWKKDVELSEFLKDSFIQFEGDFGNGSAIIISFEHLVNSKDEELFVKAIKEQLGLKEE